jgi:hypothetical protein
MTIGTSMWRLLEMLAEGCGRDLSGGGRSAG